MKKIHSTKSHPQNGASPKSQMSRGNVFKMVLVVAITAMVFSCNKSDISENRNSNILQDTIFYYGANKETTITFQEDGKTYSIQAFEGKVIVYFNDGIDLAAAQKTISDLGGAIIEQVPAIGYYLIEVGANNEGSFMSNIKNKPNVEYVSLSLVLNLCAISSETRILDHYDENRIVVNNHGDMVKSVYEKFSGKVAIVIDYGYWDETMNKWKIRERDAINDIAKSRSENTLYNISSGPAIEVIKNSVGVELQWNDADDKQKESYIEAKQMQIKNLIEQLDKVGKGSIPNVVVTMSTGNTGIPDFDKKIIETMNLNAHQKDILKYNILIVTSDEPTTDKTGKNDAMATVNIDDCKFDGKQLKGSSFAAPKALGKIRQVMEKKNISCVDALALVKKSIANNGGTLLDNVDDIINPQPQGTIAGEWSCYLRNIGDGGEVPITLREDGTANVDLDLNGTWKVAENSNSITIKITYNSPGYSYIMTLNGTINEGKNQITGDCTVNQTGFPASNGTFVMNKLQ